MVAEDPHPKLTLFFSIWAAVGPMVGLLIGYLLTTRQQRKQWMLDKRREEYRELLSSLTGSYMAIVHIYEQTNAGRPVTDEISLQAEKAKIDSFRTLRDRILIADEINIANVLVDWDTAVTNYMNTKDGKIFAQRFTRINDTLVHMARKIPKKPSPLIRWRLWRAQKEMAKYARQIQNTR